MTLFLAVPLKHLATTAPIGAIDLPVGSAGPPAARRSFGTESAGSRAPQFLLSPFDGVPSTRGCDRAVL